MTAPASASSPSAALRPTAWARKPIAGPLQSPPVYPAVATAATPAPCEMPGIDPPMRKSAGTIAAHPIPTSAKPTSAGTVDRVVIASSVPMHVSAPLRRASPPKPQRRSARSPTSRATPIAAAYATTAPAATAALAPTGPLRNTALQLIAADSTKNAQNMRTAGSASAPRGNARCALSTSAAVPPRRRGPAIPTTSASTAATVGSSAWRPMPSAAETAVTAEPPSSPKLHAACSGESSGRPRRRSSSTPCAFIATSATPMPAPRPHATTTSTASEGANAAAASAPAPRRSPAAAGARLPRRALSQPESGRTSVAVSDTAKIAIPSRPLSSESLCFSAGRRATQTPSKAPRTTKPAASARCARLV